MRFQRIAKITLANMDETDVDSRFADFQTTPQIVQSFINEPTDVIIDAIKSHYPHVPAVIAALTLGFNPGTVIEMVREHHLPVEAVQNECELETATLTPDFTPLHAAIVRNFDLAVIETLVGSGCPINTFDRYHGTVLQALSRQYLEFGNVSKSVAIAEILVEAGAKFFDDHPFQVFRNGRWHTPDAALLFELEAVEPTLAAICITNNLDIPESWAFNDISIRERAVQLVSAHKWEYPSFRQCRRKALLCLTNKQCSLPFDLWFRFEKLVPAFWFQPRLK